MTIITVERKNFTVKNTKGNSGFCRSSTEIRMFVHISVEVLQKSVKVFEKNCVQQL